MGLEDVLYGSLPQEASLRPKLPSSVRVWRAAPGVPPNPLEKNGEIRGSMDMGDTPDMQQPQSSCSAQGREAPSSARWW